MIDSHHHLWRYSAEQYGWIDDSMNVLKRDFTTDDLVGVMTAAGIDGTLAVQARQSIEETESLLAAAATCSLIRGVVGWVPLADACVGDVLDRFKQTATLCGVRHVVQDEPDEGFLSRHDFNRGVAMLESRSLVYDILIYTRQLPESIRFVDRHPNQIFVLDHIAKPTIRSPQIDETWKAQISELAKRPNVFCKFSGVITEVRDAAWTIETIRPYWDHALNVFGSQRLMYGSDWPVCLLRGEYPTWIATAGELADSLTPAERAAFWNDTAVRAYGIG